MLITMFVRTEGNPEYEFYLLITRINFSPVAVTKNPAFFNFCPFFLLSKYWR